MKALNNNANGFTLAEVLITTAILGVLISISIPTYLHVREKAIETYDINVLNEAERYAAYNGENFSEGSLGYYDSSCQKIFPEEHVHINEEADHFMIGKGTSKDGGVTTNSYDGKNDYRDALIHIVWTNGKPQARFNINDFEKDPEPQDQETKILIDAITGEEIRTVYRTDLPEAFKETHEGMHYSSETDTWYDEYGIPYHESGDMKF